MGAAAPTLIYCANGNKRCAGIAVRAGFRYGIQIPGTAHYPLYFADNDFKRPNRKRYIAGLQKHHPYMATVLDWEQPEQRDEVFSWAAEAALYTEHVLVVPKVIGSVTDIPHEIGGREVWLAYSVKSKYGQTLVPDQEFRGWKVHLLGGQPHKAMHKYQELMDAGADVVSWDGNYHKLKAIMFVERWESPGRWVPDGGRTPVDAAYRMFEISCENIWAAWHRLAG
jgi:hypothetical protein